MYVFHIKNSGPDIDIILTRALLGLAALACLLYGGDHRSFLNMIATTILFGGALLTKLIFVRFKLNKMLVLTIAALLLFFVTRSVTFAIILVLYGMLVKNLYGRNTVEVNGDGILIRRFLQAPVHTWQEFNNVILKDNLLTIDFNTNKLLQLIVDEKSGKVDEQAFNNFCLGKIAGNASLINEN